MHRIVRRIVSPLGAALLALAVAAGFAYSQIPDPDGTIHACYDTSTGALRVIDPPDRGRPCPPGQAPLVWNQTGPQGPAGPQGATGAPGQRGPAGGVKDTVTRSSETSKTGSNDKERDVECPSGTTVTGGGHQIIGVIAGRVTTRSKPSGNGWSARVQEDFTSLGGKWSLRVWVVCASL